MFDILFFLALTTPPVPCFGNWQKQELPVELEWAHDARQTTDGKIFFLTPDALMESTTSGKSASAVIGAGFGGNELFAPKELAAAEGRVVVSSAVYSFHEIDLHKRALGTGYPFWDPVDIDLFADKVAILGATRDENARYAPEGALIYVGRLDESVDDFRPIYFSEAGPGVGNFSSCSVTGVRHLRFMTDGRLVAVPVAEGGVLFFDPAGRMLRTFTAAEVGFDSGCEMGTEGLSLDEPGRLQWVNGRRVVDDIVPLPDGAAGLILRQLRDGKPQWHMKILRKDGSIQSCPLDIPTTDPLARIKADAFGDQIGLLVSRRGYVRYKSWRIIKKTGERTDYPIKLHPDEPALWLTARYRP